MSSLGSMVLDRPIDAINSVKKSIAVYKRLAPYESLDKVLEIVDKAVNECRADDNDVNYVAKFVEHIISAPYSEMSQNVFESFHKLLAETKEKLLNYMLSLDSESRRKTLELLQHWIREVELELKLWESIREKTKNIDIAEIIRSSRRM